MMKNPEYWHRLAETEYSNLGQQINSIHNLNPITRLCLAGELFQAGIFLIMDGRSNQGKEFLLQADRIYQLETTHMDYRDFTRRYIILWLTNPESASIELLEHASQKLDEEICRNVVLLELQDIYELVSRCGFFSFKKYADQFNLTFSKKGESKHPYEKIADQLVEMARMSLLMEEGFVLVKIVRSAMALYDIAIDKINEAISESCPHFGVFMAIPDEELNRSEKPEVLKYLHIKRVMLGNIPIFRYQLQIISELISLRQLSNVHSGLPVFEKMEQFFEDLICFPDKKESILGLTEEIEWCMIKHKFDLTEQTQESFYNNITVLRNILG